MLKNNISNGIKKNWFVFLAAFIVSVSIGFPEVFLRMDLGGQYKGVPLMGTDAETHYVALIQEIYDGNYGLANTFSTPKDLPYLYPGLGETVVGFSGKILGLTSTRINSAMKFISPFILFLLIYYFVFILNPAGLFRKNQNNGSESGRKKIALLSALFILLGGNIVMRPNEILNLFSAGAPYAGVFNNYFRPINPEVSSIFLFGYLILFYKLISRPFNYGYRKAVILIPGLILGIILGISFYIYLYTWTFLLTLTFISSAVLFLEKKKELFKKTLFIIFTGVLISIPYWLNVMRALSMPEYQSVSLRYEMVATRAPIISKMLVLLFAVFIFLLWRYFRAENRTPYLFWVSSILAVFAVYNQQIITGKVIQPGHYHAIITVPLIIIFTIGLGWYFFKKITILKSDFFEKIIIGAAAIILLANNFNWQISSYYRVRERAVANQDYAAVLNWLDNNTGKEEIIFASRPLSDLIPIFTSLNIYPSTYAQYYLIDGEVFKNQLFLEYRFRGIAPSEAEDRFYGDLKVEISRRLHGMRYKNNPPRAVIKETAEAYSEFYGKGWEEVLKYYPTDYFIFDKKFNEFAVSGAELNGMLEKVGELDNRFLIYKLKI